MQAVLPPARRLLPPLATLDSTSLGKNDRQVVKRKQGEESGGDSGDAAAVALLTEQQWIDEAKDAFHRYYNAKFSFECCWKQLRYSTKWLQLFADSRSHPVVIVSSLPTSTVVTEEAHAAVQAPSSTTSEEEITSTDNGATTTADPSPTAAMPASPSRSNVTSGLPSLLQPRLLHHKRRADVSLESFAHIPNQQLQGLTATLIEELKRQNDLLEDQNAIALLKVNGEVVPDEARDCYHLLRARYLKKARTHDAYSNNGRTSTLYGTNQGRVFDFERFSLANSSNLLRKVNGPNGVVDVVADIRQYWGWNHDNTDAELFANVQRQWESLRRSDDAAKDFVLQVLACGLEEQLLLWLLQPHPADAAEDIRILFTVCKDPTLLRTGASC
ncbi:hypothetical protein GQ600_14388 [Phytophthora cactorum]|nr:hypothetical protein GQ600_14388 [Phytophthora cactorum]